ncbi:MAG: hypothetical protein EAZ53_10315 [Bacteroidetes bacterium]|nr:MAG: hypothetical protein EAZ53_10315 [Bacteroidota bacterium]
MFLGVGFFQRAFCQWSTLSSSEVSTQPHLIVNNNGGSFGQGRIYFGNGTSTGTNYLQFSKAISNWGFDITLNNINRFVIYPSDIGGGTAIEPNGNSKFTVGLSTNNTNIFLHGTVFPKLMWFADNTTLNSANFITSISGLYVTVAGLGNRIGVLDGQMSLVNAQLIATNTGLNLRIDNLQSNVNTSLSGLNSQFSILNSSLLGLSAQLIATNTGLNLRIDNLQSNVNISLSGLNSQFSILNSSLLGLSAQLIATNTGLNLRIDNLQSNVNTSLSGLNSQFSIFNSSLTGVSTSISGLNSQFSILNSSLSGLNSQFSILNSSLIGINSSLIGFNSQFNNTWQTKSNGLYYCGNTTVCGNSDINGGIIKLGNSDGTMYRHCFSYFYYTGNTRNTGFAGCHENTNPNFTISGMAQTTTAGGVYLDTRTVLQPTIGTIKNSNQGISIGQTTATSIIITPQGSIKFKDGTELSTGVSNTWQKIGNNIINAGDNSVQIKGNNVLEFGAGLTKQQDAGKIVYGIWDSGLCIVGGGTTASNRRIKFFNEGGADFVGTVNIGNQKPNTSDYKLAVDGKIISKGYRSNPTIWADEVFGKDYKLASLFEVEKFISENKHLKEIPSESEVLEKGIELTALNTLLLKKIEELTLYIIQIEKRTKKLEKK